jgi:hypothetical protein
VICDRSSGSPPTGQPPRAGAVAALTEAGFVQRTRLADDIGAETQRPGWFARLTPRSKALLEYQAALTGVDGFWTKAYQRFGRWFYTCAGKASIAITVLVGLVAFLFFTPRASGDDRPVSFRLVASLPASGIRARNRRPRSRSRPHRQAPRAGDRSYGCGLGLVRTDRFIDTSDVWLADRRQRIWGSLAGPYADMVLAGVAGIAAL